MEAFSADLIIDKVDKAKTHLLKLRQNISGVIFGQQNVIDQTLITILAGGHVLLVGLPGLAKTKLVETLAQITTLEEKRIQCTPDLMPADILGSEVLEENIDGKRSFRFLPGPVFCQLLMADEINRASPRTQSALLQAMQERHISVAGHSHILPQPFHVLATQNPLEQEGTYPLPEAQLDRFLLQVNVGYPDFDAEYQMLLNTTGLEQAKPSPIMTAQELLEIQNLVRIIPVGEKIVQAILNLVRNARPETSTLDIVKKNVTWGPGPRGSQALMLAVKAKALLEGRFAPSYEDIIELACPVLRHRMALSFMARSENINVDNIIQQLCNLLD
ncbi:MAG: MoxR family ATPase [Alphaproteobacteria bacterium]|nr:MoxR family ATPase [Alphaproteobacteria bacterium]